MPHQPTVTESRLINITAYLTPALTILNELHDAFSPPFVQSILNTIQALIAAAQKVKQNKNEGLKLMENIHQVLYAIVTLYIKSDTPGSLPPSIVDHIGKFMETLHKLLTFVEAQQDKNKIKRLFRQGEMKALLSQIVRLDWIRLSQFSSQASRILLILIETGVAWMSIQITVCVIQQLDIAAFTNLDTATAIIETASTFGGAFLTLVLTVIVHLTDVPLSAQGILPAITVIIVRSQNSFESWTITDDAPLRSNHQISTLRFGFKESTGSTAGAESGLFGDTRKSNSKRVDKGDAETNPV
ncbi:hypothetical protein MVEN_02614700 [Mycena venus]|uniref:Uncharacterized protein n=1 Tax=Mycena venus TaxID=2733690 RepID=A0A8H6WR41_9AGAR|nr:hypothetical protein MVEN_02614700 [Mycena venus]